MLKSLINVTSQNVLVKKLSFTSLRAKVVERVSKHRLGDGLIGLIPIAIGGLGFFWVNESLCNLKDEEVKEIVAAIRDHEIYPKIYRLTNANVEARKALGYRIDPRKWGIWEYISICCQRNYEQYKSDAAASVITPLVRKFSLPVQGSKQDGVLQVWASRQKVEDTWELERMELKFTPREFLIPNINANALTDDSALEESCMGEDVELSPVSEDLSTWLIELTPAVTSAAMSAAASALTPRREEMIVVWVDSDTSPRAQLEDPSIDVASLPNMDDPWKIRLDDFEEPAVDYINED